MGINTFEEAIGAALDIGFEPTPGTGRDRAFLTEDQMMAETVIGHYINEERPREDVEAGFAVVVLLMVGLNVTYYYCKILPILHSKNGKTEKYDLL